MRRLSLLCCLTVLCVLPETVIAGDESPWDKKLPFKSAAIHYALSGMEEGQESLYIRDYGKQTATYHQAVSKMMGMTLNNSTIELKTPDFIYSYDLQAREGVKESNPEKYMIEEYNKLSTADKAKVRHNAEKTGAAYTEGMGGKMQQDAVEILGYSCDRVEIMGGAIMYMLHGTDIPMKTEMDMMGMKMDVVATSVEEGAVDDSFFQHPAGIVAEEDAEADAMARETARQVITMLIDPENNPQSELQPMEGMSDEEKQMMQQLEQMMQGMKGTPGSN